MSDAAPILEMKHVSKHYGGIAALSEVDFVAYPGEIHAVLGENGAGKSTLIKIAAGVTDPSDGEVFVDRQARQFSQSNGGDGGRGCVRVPGTVVAA